MRNGLNGKTAQQPVVKGPEPGQGNVQVHMSVLAIQLSRSLVLIIQNAPVSYQIIIYIPLDVNKLLILGDIFIKKETCQFAKFPKYYTSCKNDATICSDSGGEFNPCEGDTPDPENMYFCTAEIPDIPELKRPWVKCSDECFDANCKYNQ